MSQILLILPKIGNYYNIKKLDRVKHEIDYYSIRESYHKNESGK